MAIVTYPLNGITYGAEDAETYLCTRTSGVYSSDKHFRQSVTGNREVTISPGLAWIQNTEYTGKSVYNDAPIAVTIPVADGALPRIDRIVLKFDKAANKSTIELKQGEASAQPTAPAVTRTELIYELGLCTVSVPASSVIVSEGDVTSTLMDESVCGLMRDGVTGLPSQDLYDSFESNTQREIDTAREKFNQSQTQLDSDIESLIETKTGELDGTISTFTDDARQEIEESKSGLQSEQDSWAQWYANIQETLGESAAKVGAVPLTRKVNGLQLDKDIDIPISKDYELEIPVEGWAADDGGLQKVDVIAEGITTEDTPIVDVRLTSDLEQNESIMAAWMLVSKIETGEGQITVFATEQPEIAIPIQLKVVEH